MPHILQSRNMIEMRDILFKTRNQMELITFGNDKTAMFCIPVHKQASTQKCSTVIFLLQLRKPVISQHLYSFDQVKENKREDIVLNHIQLTKIKSESYNLSGKATITQKGMVINVTCVVV